MNELFGFLSVDELAGAIAAWREMEKRARQVFFEVKSFPDSRHIFNFRWILKPVGALDHTAGMKALGYCKNCGADLANPANYGDGIYHTEKDCIVKLRRELKTVRAIYFRAIGEPNE